MDLRRQPPDGRGLSPARRARLQVARLERVDVTVGGALDSFGERQLGRSVDDHEPTRAGILERRDRLVRGEVPAQTVRALLALLQRRLAEEEVCVAADLGQVRARRRVTGIGEDRLAVADAQRIGLKLVVRDANGRDREAVGLEGLALRVFAELERVEHACKAEPLTELRELRTAARREPELRGW